MSNKIKISVVIPVYNEKYNIKEVLDSLSYINPFEIIVVDGGSIDDTINIAKSKGAKIVITDKGRGKQIREGIKIARGEIILILHADTRLSPSVRNEDFMLDEQYVAGFFKLKYFGGNFATKIVELFANIRSLLHYLPYGDQAIFVKKEILERIGNVKAFPFLEDVDLVLRLRKEGKIKFVNKPIFVSPRKLLKGGFFHPFFHSFKNFVIVIFFLMGVSPERLIKYYK
jgi:rSAM/selenodomain-associated transferase 2